MNKFPDPADYINDVLNDVHRNLVNEQREISKKIAYKLVGVSEDSFRQFLIPEETTQRFKNKLQPDFLATVENNIINGVEKLLPSLISKRLIDELSKKIIYRLTLALEDKIYNNMCEQLEAVVDERVKEVMATWLVTARLMDK